MESATVPSDCFDAHVSCRTHGDVEKLRRCVTCTYSGPVLAESVGPFHTVDVDGAVEDASEAHFASDGVSAHHGGRIAARSHVRDVVNVQAHRSAAVRSGHRDAKRDGRRYLKKWRWDLVDSWVWTMGGAMVYCSQTQTPKKACNTVPFSLAAARGRANQLACGTLGRWERSAARIGADPVSAAPLLPSGHRTTGVQAGWVPCAVWLEVPKQDR
mmetsp:Transcript_9749/g.59209  ORF Transcript_9749/g.59209 Transcript_9749/m.59209 type:complete len:214 (+) Transcript_9749:1084-1725(+)